MRTIRYKEASVTLAVPMGLPEEMRQGADEVVDLFVEPAYRNQGMASALMQRICRGADSRCKVLILQPRAYDDCEMSELELAAWYTKMGFEIVQTEPVLLMARAPRQ